jgi:hypothetical protein
VQYPTVIPAYDPAEYAEQSELRERMPTLTDDAALEQARLQSFPTSTPPARNAKSTVPVPARAPAPAPTPPPAPARRPAPSSGRYSSAEIVTGESELDDLGIDEQIAILEDRLAPLTRVPMLARRMSELGALLADPKTAYVVGFVDGILPLETIIDVTGLPELDTLRVLDRLLAQGVITFRR